jgi:hypothetical protein
MNDKPEFNIVKRESRVSFGIAYFDDEAEADRYGRRVQEWGCTYNGGFRDGERCGRDSTWDHVDPDGRQLYAVTEG